MKKSPKNIIIGVINTNPNEIKKMISSLNKKCISYLDGDEEDAELEKYKGKHIFFDGVNQFTKGFSKKIISATPFIWDTPYSLNTQSISENLIYADAKLSRDGYVFLRPLDKDKFKTYLNAAWTKSPTEHCVMKFTPDKIATRGRVSNIAKIINRILFTLPSFVHIPFMVALTEAIKGNMMSFGNFIRDNRLVNKSNRQFFFNLDSNLFKIKLPLLYFINKDRNSYEESLEQLSKKDKRNLNTVQNIVNKFKKYNLKDFMDIEDNINIRPRGVE